MESENGQNVIYYEKMVGGASKQYKGKRNIAKPSCQSVLNHRGGQRDSQCGDALRYFE